MANVFKAFKKVANPVQQLLDQAKALKQQKRSQEAIELLVNASQRLDDRRIVSLLAGLLLDAAAYSQIAAHPGIGKYEPRMHALAQVLAKAELTESLPLCLSDHPPLPNVAYVAMVKDEQDIILVNLLWHYNLGLRKFFIIDNLSTDETCAHIALFERLCPDAQVYVLHDPIVEYIQGKKTTGACRFAMTVWDDLQWLLLVDADEFLCTTQPLQGLFADIPQQVDALIVPKSVYALTPDESVDDDDLFYRRMQHRAPLSHVSSKVIIRADIRLHLSQGNHRVFDGNGQEVGNYLGRDALSFREFPIRSRAHFIRKIINGGKAIAEAKRQGLQNVGGTHWAALYDCYLAEGEAGLSKRFAARIQNSRNEIRRRDPLPVDAVIGQFDFTGTVAEDAGLSLLLRFDNTPQ